MRSLVKKSIILILFNSFFSFIISMESDLWDKNLPLLMRDKSIQELEEVVFGLKWPIFSSDFSEGYKSFKKEHSFSMDEDCKRQVLIKIIDNNIHAWESYFRYKYNKKFC